MSTKNNLDFASFQVRDLQKSKEFYTDVLGFEPTNDERPNAVVFKNSAGAIFAIRTPMRPLPKQGQLGVGASLWFDVSDVEDLHTRIVNHQGNVIAPPQDGPFGRQMMVTDLDGYMLVFHQMQNG